MRTNVAASTDGGIPSPWRAEDDAAEPAAPISSAPMDPAEDTAGSIEPTSPAPPIPTVEKRRPSRITPSLIWVVSRLVPASATAGIGVWGLTTASIDRDETSTIDIGTRTVGQILHQAQHADVVHTPYYILMHYWMGYFGTTPAAIRAFSVVGAVLGAIALTSLATRFMATVWAVVAGLLFAAAPAIELYAHDAREYTTMTALASISGLALTAAIISRRWAAWIFYALSAIGVVVTHFFGILLLVAHGVTVVTFALSRRQWRPVGDWVLSMVGVGAVLSPFISLAYSQRATLSWMSPPTWGTVGNFWVQTAGGVWLIAPLGLLALGSMWPQRRNGSPPPEPHTISVWMLGLPWLLVPPTALFVASFAGNPTYQYRYVLICVPALILLTAAGLSRIRPRLLAVPIVLTLLAAMVCGQVRDPNAGANDTRGVAAYLNEMKLPGDSILFLVAGQRYMANSYPSSYVGLHDLSMDVSQADAGTFAGSDVPDAVLRQRMSSASRVWAIKYWAFPANRPGNLVIEGLRYQMLHDAGFKWVSTVHFRGIAVLLFIRAQPHAKHRRIRPRHAPRGVFPR